MARSRIEIAGEALEAQPDGDLALRAATGDREAFEELYRRHSRTAMRVAYRVTGNIHDAGDAVSDAFARVMQALPKGSLTDPTRFRSYLLTSTRHAAVDVLRRSGKAVPVEEDPEPAQTRPSPSEVLIDAADSALVAAAFRTLPERWRSVLWLTEVEQIPPREAAGMLGVSPNGVAQLAVRARAGLRERYLQAHLRTATGDCRPAVERLGAYVGGALAARDIALVDQHLADCEACRERHEDLRQIGTTLRRGLAPVGAGAGGWLWRLVEKVNRHAAAFANPAGPGPVAGKAVGMAAAGVFVASLAGAGVVHNRVADAAAPRPAPVAVVAATGAQPAGAAAGTTAVSTTGSKATTTASAAATPDRPVQPRTVRPAAPRVRARDLDEAERTQAAEPATTTTTAPESTTPTTEPPASHADDSTGVTLPEVVPTTLPTLPGLPGVPEIPVPTTVLGQTLTDALMDALAQLPLDAVAVLEDASAASLGDQLLPAPEAPGLPV